ncbi:MAG: exodeoxyribonuclease III [Acidobacteriota bacterium]|nr:exodeoxyribonuclease III [Acidobacteriota bacterium]
MKIATWNVNSIRQRIDRVAAWTGRERPDVLCLQETKCVDELFPLEPFTSQGYHVELYGQRTYNGVAILSLTPMTEVVRGLPDDPPDADRRLLAATIAGVRVVDIYVPNGQSVESEKFPFKLRWLERLHAFLAATASPRDPLLLLGDFNIAPEDRDVHDPELWRGQVLFHPLEHEALGRLTGWGLHDLFRLHHAEGGFYSWWDYRMLGFPKNRGLRIDLVLGTAPMRDRSTAATIDRNERKGKSPSDHAPVVVEIAAG